VPAEHLKTKTRKTCWSLEFGPCSVVVDIPVRVLKAGHLHGFAQAEGSFVEAEEDVGVATSTFWKDHYLRNVMCLVIIHGIQSTLVHRQAFDDLVQRSIARAASRACVKCSAFTCNTSTTKNTR